MRRPALTVTGPGRQDAGDGGRGEVTPGLGHLRALEAALAALERELPRLDRWGGHLAARLASGARLLAAGNGGSAAHAQHLTSELVGRYLHDRPAFAAIALPSECSAVTAIGNDYGWEQVFARQVRAHGRPGDLLVALSTSGTSANILAAAEEARMQGLTTWALTGPRPNPLAATCDDALCVDAPATATIQEVHQVAVHLVCAAFDARLVTGDPEVTSR